MRYYNLKLTKQDGSPMPLNSLNGSPMPPGEVTSLISAQLGGQSNSGTNPSALNIEFDMPQYMGHVGGASTSNYIRLWGIGLEDLKSATSFNRQKLELSAGMADGYPLATPSQRGLLVKGDIIQAFGNWLGTDMTLDFFILPSSSGSATTQVNYVLSGKKGEKLADVIRRALTQANEHSTIEININPSRVLNSDEHNVASTLTEFAMKVTELTQRRDTNGTIVDDGVVIAPGYDGKIRVFEAIPSALPNRPRVKKIEFQDLLGQVTWAEPFKLTAKLVMRGDLNIGDLVEFPPGLSTVTAGAFSSFGTTGRIADSLTFSGVFQIIQMHHWGNFRQADAMSWNTTIWALPAPDSSGSGQFQAGTGLRPPPVPLL